MTSKITRAICVFAAVACTSASASDANAYAHRWECDRGSGNHCTDHSGKTFNPWTHIEAESWGVTVGIPDPTGPHPVKVGHLCLGARTAAGNERTIYGQACGYGTWTWQGDLAADPYSQAYVYWGGGGAGILQGKLLLKGYAST